MIFFTDCDLGHRFPEILQASDLDVKKHDDVFPDVEGLKDVDWLSYVGERGWIAISHDKGISRKPNEINAVMRAEVRLFIVVGTNATFPELAENFVANKNKILQFATTHREPFIARIYRPTPEQKQKGSRKTGRIELWLSYQEWKRKTGG